jgi:hypothetical protein
LIIEYPTLHRLIWQLEKLVPSALQVLVPRPEKVLQVYLTFGAQTLATGVDELTQAAPEAT